MTGGRCRLSPTYKLIHVACHSFVDACRSHKISGMETWDFITEMVITRISALVRSLIPMGPHKENQETRIVL
jgi:hypothetical protein